MREPIMVVMDNGVEIERLPFSQCPTFLLKKSAGGETKQFPSEDGCLGDGAFNRQYAARLLSERGSR